MGSTDKAVITGFICRLCSKMNRFVIHIYGEEGERMKLAEKINAYLPITVSSSSLFLIFKTCWLFFEILTRKFQYLLTKTNLFTHFVNNFVVRR